MNAALPLMFLHRFDGLIWNLLATEEVLLIEVRNADSKVVSFSALNTDTNRFLWENKVLEEKWWINASAIVGSTIIFTIYMDTNNPDKKGIVAYSLHDLQLQWWNNDFSLSETGEKQVKGFSSKIGLKEVVLNVVSGKEEPASGFERGAPSSFLQRPVQYAEGHPYFDTVKTFLADRLNFLAVSALEYLEYGNRIIISGYTTEEKGLANYLFVLSAEGNVLLKEKLVETGKGIGLDTFFTRKGCVIFVRNRVELVSYKII